MRKSKGYRHGTRSLFKKKVRKRGIRPLDYILRDFTVGSWVDIIIDPSEHRGMPHRRYHGKTGRIERKQGRAYVVAIRDGKIIKHIIANKEHLRISKSVPSQQQE
ncbi:MAG: 50S ribosomal protein L21e [Candidatus Heimdallarchaeaceae archaeon]